MSSNDLVTIIKKKGKYRVSHKDAETGWVLGKEIVVDTAEEALKEASKIESEYGINYIED